MGFEENLAKVCVNASFPEQMSIIERDEKGQVYVDFEDAMGQGGKTLSIKEMGESVKQDVVTACKFVLEEEFKSDLLDKFLVKSRPDGKDIDFTGFICGNKLKACDIEEEESEEDSDEL